MITVNIEFEEGTKGYDFPTSWDEVTVEQFIKIYEVSNMTFEGILGSVKMMSAISGIDEEILMMMDIEDFKNLANKLDFVTSNVPKNEVESIKIGEDDFYVYSEFNKFTTGEIITIELLLEKCGGNIIPIIPDLLCLFLRKKREDGKYEKFNTDLMSRKESFKQVPISQIFHIFAFFLTGKNLFSENIQESLQKQDQK